MLSFTNEHMYMNSVIKKLNALDRSVMKQQRQGGLVAVAGRAQFCSTPCVGGGVN